MHSILFHTTLERHLSALYWQVDLGVEMIYVSTSLMGRLLIIIKDPSSQILFVQLANCNFKETSMNKENSPRDPHYNMAVAKAGSWTGPQ